MNPDLLLIAARVRELISRRPSAINHQHFSALALELFALQYQHNSAYRRICGAREITPRDVAGWPQIPAVPALAFKELELTCIPPDERTAVFHSSGTTEQKLTRHFHCPESLAVYEASLWVWFESRVARSPESGNSNFNLAVLTPPPAQAPHSSLVHMFDTVRQKLAAGGSPFVGKLAADGSWTLDIEATWDVLSRSSRKPDASPLLLVGTAFSFVHLLDYLVERGLTFQLPAKSRVMETGGYKNRSRTLPKTELHALITKRLGVPRENIICEYGMSELSSQAYDSEIHPPSSMLHPRVFRFPPWARAQIISPETGCEVAEGETGLIRVLDLANVLSVAAIQTEDLGIRRGDGFELIGRAQLAEPRGCSLMAA